MPIHPRTKKYIASLNIPLDFKTIEPVGYFDMLSLTENCKLVLTDSGGLQKEAYFFNKFCITLRDQTEWVELVHAGANRIAGAKMPTIINDFEELKNKPFLSTEKLYGEGDASAKIAKHFASF